MKCTGCSRDLARSNFWTDNRRGRRLTRCKDCKRDYMREYRKQRPRLDHERYWKNPEGERYRHTSRKYGVDKAKYETMLAAQGGACAICRSTPSRPLAIDHDHSTGKVRGLLCTRCNQMLGHAADSAITLRAAIKYLASSRKSRRSSSSQP